MTDPNKESGQEAEVSPEVKPDPAVPQFSDDKQPSVGGEADPQALAKALLPALKALLIGDEEFIRAGQSVKDKRLKFVDEFPLTMDELRRLKKYAEKYGDEDEAIRQIQIDRELLGKRQPPSQAASNLPVSDPGRSEREDLKSWVSRQLKSASIEPDDPEYEELVNGFKDEGDEAEFRASVRVLSARRKTAQATSDVNVQPERTGVRQATLTNEALEDSFRKEMLAARGQGMDVGRAIKEKFRQKGLDVDSIRLA